MNERQKALYEYLLDNGDNWVSQVQIARDLFKYYGNGECCLEPKSYHDTTERSYISDDVRAINISAEFDKLIISSSKGVKIANEAEFDRYIKAQYTATIRKLSRIYKMAKKGNRHNQIGIDGMAVEAFLQKVDETT